MKQLFIILSLLIISSLRLLGQSEEIDNYFKTEISEISMDFGELTYLDLMDIVEPDSIVSELSDNLTFQYAEIRADQFGMPIALSIPLIIDKERKAVFIPKDVSHATSFMKLLSENINPDLNKEDIAERLFVFIEKTLLQTWTMGLENFELKDTNIQTVVEGENVRVIEIGFFEDNLGTKKMHQIHDITVLFSDNMLKEIK